MKSPLAWLALGVFGGVWSWLAYPISPLILAAMALAILASMSGRRLGFSIAGLGLCLGQALVWTQPEPGQLRSWTSAEVRAVSGKAALLLTPEGHLWSTLWPSPPPVGTRIAGRLRPKAERQVLPGEWPPHAQARLARARLVKMKTWTPLTEFPESLQLPKDLVNPGLVKALGMGDRSAVPAPTTELLRRTGTIHLLAISGLHVGMVSMMAGMLAWLLTRPLTRGRWPPVAKALPVVTASVAAIGYGELVQWPVSAQRAAVMVVSASLLSLCGRRPSAWQILGLAALAILCVQPSQAANLGFLMSFGAVTAILLGMPAWTLIIRPGMPWLVRATIHSIGATIFATLGTLPVTAWVFQTLPLGGPLANLIAVPLFAGLGVPCSILGTIGPSWLQTPCLWLADQTISLALLWIRAWDLGVATPAFGPTAALALVGCVLLRSSISWSAVLLIFVLSPWHPSPGGFTVTFPAIGQGSAALVTWPDGRHWLIDGGPPGRRLLHWLRRSGVHRLERVILSHPDLDHYGGLLPVIASLNVDEFWTSRPPLDAEVDYRELWRTVSSRSIPVRTPALVGLNIADDNDNGLTVMLRHGSHRFLFLGDVSERVENRLASALQQVTILQVSHHGSKTASSPSLIASASPKAAVIQSGVGNRYGHPHAQTLSRWTGTKILRTDALGSVRLRSDGHDLITQRWSAVFGWRSLPDRRPELH